MRLHVVGTGSNGNAYILDNGREALLLEAGVKFTEIKKALGFRLQHVVGCLVTHEHQDHCKSVLDAMASGIDVYATVGTHKAMGTHGHYRARPVLEDKQYTAGSFRFIPFHVKHDAAQPVGYMIHHPETGNVLFVTDTYYVPNRFKGLNNILVEANYCQSILEERLQAGASPEFLRNRIFKSHMSLATCKELLSANDLTGVNNIVLIHLSDSNSHEERFQREVAEHTGKRVHVARAGLTIENFGLQPF
jgi:phosphoribosyl 1,2-cyclic phosphodiesterase